MAAITFTDTIGTATLGSPFDPPGNRASNWVPLATAIGPISYGLGTGIPEQWAHRTDYGASFTLPNLSDDSQAVAARLIVHLKKAGSVTVATDDSVGNAYTGCYLWPGTEPKFTERAQPSLLRSFTVSLLQPGATEPLICLY